MTRTALLAMMGPLALAGCMMPVSRMPPTSPVAIAPMAQPAAAQPAYPQQPMAAPAAWPMAGAPAQTVPGLPPSTEPAPTATRGIAGLQERKPDLCKAETYATSIGQPGSTVPSLGITRSYRVVDYRGIEPQEYVPDRIVFRLDAAGNISTIDCG
ncbi:MAG: hypothetical protein ACK41U_07955 [Paracoccus sp. (in: a-proteobacteria)]|uniref:hypothetical protein n=1 Tax=Paracoccus sp. TaxID=267 RepID=UPI00391CE786